MPGANTTIDARAALAAVISDRYGQDISGGEWSTTTPSKDPPKGLGSKDGADWRITLDRSSDKMSDQGYSMSDISLGEADAKRTAVLDESVSLLVAKASDRSLVAREPRRRSRNLSLILGSGALVGLLAFIGASLRRKGGRRR